MEKQKVNIRHRSDYVVTFVTIDGEEHRKEFSWHQSRTVIERLRPKSEHGINYVEDGVMWFVPWCQVKRASFSEVIVGEEVL